MLYKLEQHGKPTLFYWQLGAGPLRLLGNCGEVAEMAYAVIDHFSGKNSAPIPDLPEQPAEAAPCYTVPEAISAAQGLDVDRRRLGVTIRSAARAGRIAGAYRTPEGYWRLPVAAFNAWIAEHAEQRRGRPRKEASAAKRIDVDDPAACTVNIYRNVQTGEEYALKRDYLGVAVGAFGPLDYNKGDITIRPDDWSESLGRQIVIDRLLGGYEEVVIGE